jgi:lysozyme
VLRVLRRDLREYEAAVREAVGRRLPQQQFDACVSLCFNIGIAAFKQSTVASLLRTGHPYDRARLAADAFLLWDNPTILRPRRMRERALFKLGRYA